MPPFTLPLIVKCSFKVVNEDRWGWVCFCYCSAWQCILNLQHGTKLEKCAHLTLVERMNKQLHQLANWNAVQVLRRILPEQVGILCSNFYYQNSYQCRNLTGKCWGLLFAGVAQPSWPSGPHLTFMITSPPAATAAALLTQLHWRTNSDLTVGLLMSSSILLCNYLKPNYWNKENILISFFFSLVDYLVHFSLCSGNWGFPMNPRGVKNQLLCYQVYSANKKTPVCQDLLPGYGKKQRSAKLHN